MIPGCEELTLDPKRDSQEPSTGMDPIARRFMWDIISRMTTTDRNCSVILTTHSMEEAESLCNVIGIMVRTEAAVCVSLPSVCPPLDRLRGVCISGEKSQNKGASLALRAHFYLKSTLGKPRS